LNRLLAYHFLEVSMQSDPDLLDALQTDLAELTALHAPSGCEQPVIARLHELFAPLVETIAVDHLGNLTATREGPPGAPHVVVSAHADEIGALVASIEPEGVLGCCPLAGFSQGCWRDERCGLAERPESSERARVI
jgi:putative aminopeptidase FrvX